jgi:hypothetical protein
MSKVFFDSNSMILELLGLADNTLPDTDGSYYISSATVTGEIVDEDATQLWTGSLLYVSTPSIVVIRDGVSYPDGNYRAVVPETIAWATKIVRGDTRFQIHWAKVTADDGANRDGYWEEMIKVETRNFGDNT